MTAAGKSLLIVLLFLSLSGCGGVDNTRFYQPIFSPGQAVIPVCPHPQAKTGAQISSIIISQKPGLGGCGPQRNDWISISSAGVSGGAQWIPYDGSFGGAGTNYSMETLFPENRKMELQRRVPSVDSKYFAPDQIEDKQTFQSGGLEWEHSVIREFTKYPVGDGLGQNPAPGEARLQRLRDVYIHKHPDGWWLRVQASFKPEMEDFPEILISRRNTLRQVVESIRIEPKDPARVTCRADDRGRESCRYRWP